MQYLMFYVHAGEKLWSCSLLCSMEWWGSGGQQDGKFGAPTSSCLNPTASSQGEGSCWLGAGRSSLPLPAVPRAFHTQRNTLGPV